MTAKKATTTKSTPALLDKRLEEKCRTMLASVGMDHPDDRVSNKLSQLRSLLMSMYGVGAEGFQKIGPRHRDHLLWLASDLAEDIGRLSEVCDG